MSGELRPSGLSSGHGPARRTQDSPWDLPGSSATIVACSSALGPAQRAILRASGPDCARLLGATFLPAGADPDACFGLEEFLQQRGFRWGRFDDGVGQVPVLVLWMPGPASYTREDVFELHLPGAPALLEAALARLLALGAQLAQRGEFTRRAFLNGRLDLTRAEGVLELVAASTEREARSAQELLGGGLERRVSQIRSGLEASRALVEASLDFDESDTGHVPVLELQAALARTCTAIEDAIGWENRRQAPNSTPRVVLVGLPNAGKSTLFNALVSDGHALVSDQSGTTRDWLEGTWDLDGHSVRLIDTAGLGDPVGELDREAQALGLQRAQAADLILYVAEQRTAGNWPFELPSSLSRCSHLIVRSKGDLIEGFPPEKEKLAGTTAAAVDSPGAFLEPPLGEFLVSAAKGSGLAGLARAVARELGFDSPSSNPEGEGQLAKTGSGRESKGSGGLGAELLARHRAALEQALGAAQEASNALEGGVALDWVAEALRGATEALDAISGETTPEDLLDRIFSRFCLGK